MGYILIAILAYMLGSSSTGSSVSSSEAASISVDDLVNFFHLGLGIVGIFVAIPVGIKIAKMISRDSR